MGKKMSDQENPTPERNRAFDEDIEFLESPQRLHDLNKKFDVPDLPFAVSLRCGSCGAGLPPNASKCTYCGQVTLPPKVEPVKGSDAVESFKTFSSAFIEHLRQAKTLGCKRVIHSFEIVGQPQIDVKTTKSLMAPLNATIALCLFILDDHKRQSNQHDTSIFNFNFQDGLWVFSGEQHYSSATQTWYQYSPTPPGPAYLDAVRDAIRAAQGLPPFETRPEVFLWQMPVIWHVRRNYSPDCQLNLFTHHWECGFRGTHGFIHELSEVFWSFPVNKISAIKLKKSLLLLPNSIDIVTSEFIETRGDVSGVRNVFSIGPTEENANSCGRATAVKGMLKEIERLSGITTQ